MIRCLLIDDNGFDRKIVRQAAKDCAREIELAEAADIRTAERMLADAQFDCILLDLNLPDEDGLSFAERYLTTHPGAPPIIMLTGEGSEQVVRAAFQLGILDYWSKADLTSEALEIVLSSALAKDQMRRDRQAALDELRRSNETLSRFAEIVAHDVKAPIRQMKRFSSFLGEDHRSALNADGQELLDSIERIADRTDGLIDGILAFARLNKTGGQRIEVDLRAVVDHAAANLADTIEDTGASIKISDLPTVIGNEPQLMQLFQNLINNTLKYRHTNRRPVIVIEAKRLQQNSLELTVKDNGIGIAEENQERIFNMLERLHSQDEYEGFGIGLATCQRIVEGHNGRIWCRSEEGVGSAFVFTLDQTATKEPAVNARRGSRAIHAR